MATSTIERAASREATVTPMEQRIEIERQTFDVRHLIRVEREGKPFRQHLDSTEGLDVRGRVLFSPIGAIMFGYLDEMRVQAKREIAHRLATMPITEALANEDLLYWWGTHAEHLYRIVGQWYEHAQTCRRKGDPIPTPAYWLLKNKPPFSFRDGEDVLKGVQAILANFIVEGEKLYLTTEGSDALRGRYCL